VLHARSSERAEEAKRRLPEAKGSVVGDFMSMERVRSVADKVNKLGTFDAMIRNAAVGYKEANRIETVDGLAHVFAVNTLAAYILTALINRPKRLVYVSSGMHQQGDGPCRFELAATSVEWDTGLFGFEAS
jgi:NAD(P)-dependent dehydrogenase (short-subunit alcohol dehydrogenase family)